MSREFESLDKAFNIEPDQVEKSIEKVNSIGAEVVKVTSDDVEKDYNYVRSQLYSLIEKGKNAIDDLYEIASRCENPARSYEVLFQGIKNIADISDKLPDLQKKVKDIDEDRSSPKSVTNNTVFFGSTSELSKLLKQEVLNNIEDLNEI
jgi:hypothetical protein